jgi:Cu/Ag efflux pump CusA
MRTVVAWSVRFRLLVVPAAAVLTLFAAFELRSAPIDVLPEFAPTYVEVQTEALGLSATEVESLITVPLERDLLNGVAGVEVIRSESVLGLSSITLVFEPGTDLLDARQLVQERLIQAHILPNVAKPPTMLQPQSAQSRVLMVGLASDELSLPELGLLARWTIRPRLMSVPGVSNVVIWGQRDHQLQVHVDPRRLRQSNVTLQQIVSTTGNAQLVSPLSFLAASTPGTGGFIDTPNQRLQVRHLLPIAEATGLAQVPVEGTNGRRLRLGEVAEVVESHQPLIGDAIVDGRPGLILVVEKFPRTNALEVTRDVEDAIDLMRPGLSGIEIDSALFRPATFVEEAMDNLLVALVAGLVLLVLVLFALFLEWRAVLVSLVTIPVSLLAAALVLSLRGETLNAIAFAGLLLAIGVVTDDAVVAAQTVRRRRGDAEATLVEATIETRGPLVYATVIALLAVLPVFFLGGLAGAFFEPLAVSYVLAVAASMAVAVTVAPAIALTLSASAKHDRQDLPLLRRATPRYTMALSDLLHRPVPVLAAVGIVGAVALLLTPLLRQDVVPSFKERSLLVHLNGPPGTSRPEMVRILNRAGRELRSVDGVRSVGAHVGRAVMGDEVAGVNAGAIWVTLDADAAYDEAVSRVESVIDGFPGLERELTTYSAERVRTIGALADGNERERRTADGLAALTGLDAPVVVRIYGKELVELERKAAQVRERLAEVDGVVNARVESQPREPTLEIEPKLAAAREHGIKPGDIRRAAATLVQGIEVGSLFEEQKVFDVVVTGVPEVRHSPTSVRDLLIDTPDGDQVRLNEVADVRVASAPTTIRREATSRRIDVSADVRGRDVDDVLGDVETRLATVEFPLEYHAEVLEERADEGAVNVRVVGFAIAAALAAFLLLQVAFGSWRLSGLFLLALPFALSGGLIGALVAGRSLSLGALAGFLVVLAVAVRHGVLFVSSYQRRLLDGEPPGQRLLVRSAEQRLGGVAAGLAATAAVLLPFLVLGSIPGHEIAHPMAAVALTGLVTAALFALFVIPALYALVGPADPHAAEGDLT